MIFYDRSLLFVMNKIKLEFLRILCYGQASLKPLSVKIHNSKKLFEYIYIMTSDIFFPKF